uniref:CCB3 n=1 Tax=Mantoniella antarctica TaxID=81844 RepID=A0A7S0SK33_9CHLO|mmetsp:Transcript_27878/g.70028  ORF Transcript_27878/g.70028 Transcript_27878/m.70028 type:complete len:197 (+) Transcript_27878:204-794(+)|eukprot:CAMPEP_0181366722 /NCGR_PEP_ID=MMETSP1106-20121128/10882_1 /TAXON_ID=81844 /ORGANISM="Mantoniella antarctica, Strain SL-175" /LENGTH=196 /DNA_ID=CAMNT_0023482143 /DNA_START=192 /DNA_END=782 /DNA_ORIENTATION=+
MIAAVVGNLPLCLPRRAAGHTTRVRSVRCHRAVVARAAAGEGVKHTRSSQKAVLAAVAAAPAALFAQASAAAESEPGQRAVAAAQALFDTAASDPLDPETAKQIAGFLGPFFSLSTILFIVRIVMTWYPSVPISRLPWVIAYVPTEPILKPTRKAVPPVGGVDVSPIIWVGMISFMNEILLGKQGLLILLSNKQIL